MNTARLKRFATEARNKLRQGVANRLVALGFDETGVPKESPIEVAGGAVWHEKPCTMAFYRGFKALEEQIRRHGINHVVEEAAYTWFNRLMAIRILAMNQLCEPVLRYVGSTRTPFIVDNAREGNIPDMKDEDRKALMQLLDDDTKTTEQFAMLIAAFCHNTPLIAKCFELTSDYTDILIPANILSEGGFIDLLNSTDFITEDDYRSSELLGWLYQFYISEKKDQVFAKKGKYDADDIPAATQIFTPNWIVKYMVQNSILPQLMPEEHIDREKYKYFVPSPDGSKSQTPNTKYLEIEDMKVADLACGSGHILNECFDLLYNLYIPEGYTRREAIECIFTKNLTGIDIDTRAKQLATFALMLKACQRDSSLVDASLMPRVYDMSGMPEESHELGSIQIFDEPDSSNPVVAALSTEYDAVVMNPPYMGSGSFSDILSSYIKREYPCSKADLMTVFMEVAMRLTKKDGFWAMINLPSWMFISSFEQLRANLLSTQHIQSLLHLGRGIFGSDFGSVSFVVQNVQSKSCGVYRRLFKEHVQVRSVEKIQQNFLESTYGYFVANQSDFGKIPGRPIGYWISKKRLKIFEDDPVSSHFEVKEGLKTGDNNRFIRMWYEVSFKNDLKWFPHTKGGDFRRWYGNNLFVLNYANDGQELRLFKGSSITAPENFFKSYTTWGRISSGIISMRWTPNGFIPNMAGLSAVPKYNDDRLNYALTAWGNSNMFRDIIELMNPTINVPPGLIAKTPFRKKFLNSDMPEISANCISISKSDWDAHETSWDFQANELVRIDEKEAIQLIEEPYHEQGMMVSYPRPEVEKISFRLDLYKKKWERMFHQLHANEEELNRRFIEIYGLQDELTPDVPLNEITILQQGEIKITDQYDLTDNDGTVFTDEDGAILTVSGDTYIDWQDDVIIKQLISYAVGCMMGRYRLDRPGLAIAHPNETPEEVAEYEIPNTKNQTPNTPPEKFWIDTDGIIPLLPENCGFHDNAVNRMATFVRQVFGNDTQSENLNFIEQCLGKSIEQYFIKDFWKDHKKMYQNRPIYWLFASKKGAFQVLVYVHRMNVATVERIRSRYLLPYIERLNKRIDDLQSNESTLSTKERNLLKSLRAQVDECAEYHNRLAVVAERGIVPDLDAGIPANHALYGNIVTKLK